MKYMFAMGVEQVLTKDLVNKLQTWAAWPIFQIKEPKRLKLPRVSSHPELRYHDNIFPVIIRVVNGYIIVRLIHFVFNIYKCLL